MILFYTADACFKAQIYLYAGRIRLLSQCLGEHRAPSGGVVPGDAWQDTGS